MLRISIASDHRGVHIKSRLVQTLTANGFTVCDEGTHSDQAVDYPDFAKLVARKVSRGEVDRGILICGSAIGMSIAANKFPGVRAAPCNDDESCEMSRRHNNLNVLCLSADKLSAAEIERLTGLWLRTEFEGGRHQRRIDKIAELEHEACRRLIDALKVDVPIWKRDVWEDGTTAWSQGETHGGGKED